MSTLEDALAFLSFIIATRPRMSSSQPVPWANPRREGFSCSKFLWLWECQWAKWAWQTRVQTSIGQDWKQQVSRTQIWLDSSSSPNTDMLCFLQSIPFPLWSSPLMPPLRRGSMALDFLQKPFHFWWVWGYAGVSQRVLCATLVLLEKWVSWKRLEMFSKQMTSLRVVIYIHKWKALKSSEFRKLV